MEAIDRAEDRELFKEAMEKIGQPLIPSATATEVTQALAIAEKIGYPVIVRPAFTLGGAGGGVAYSAEELKAVAAGGLEASPIHQALIEKYIYGWKEIEFEVIRDRVGNAIAVCSMENFDPVGVHTGDSIVVAPALTLANREYQMLRTAALKIITELGVVGGCNCQFALDPDSFDYAVIEVNPRVSRLVGAGVQGHGLSHRQGRGEAGAGLHAGRDQKRRHRQDLRLLRAGGGLCGGQVPALAVRQVFQRQPETGHADEGHRRGHGHRPLVRDGADEGRARRGDRHGTH